jgi:hypothetical protein
MRRDPLALLIPVLRRPHRVEPVIASIEAATPPPFRILFIASPGDEAEHDALKAAGALFMEVEGNYATKINAAIQATDEPLIFTGADDLDFRPGWLEAALEVMAKTGAMVIGTQDLCNPRVIAGAHATHFLVRRAYVEEHGTLDGPGELLHEGYEHEYVDDELIGTARARGLYAFAGRSVVKHLHPLGGYPTDELYEGAAGRMRRSRGLYRKRRRLWQALAS